MKKKTSVLKKVPPLLLTQIRQCLPFFRQGPLQSIIGNIQLFELRQQLQLRRQGCSRQRQPSPTGQSEARHLLFGRRTIYTLPVAFVNATSMLDPTTAGVLIDVPPKLGTAQGKVPYQQGKALVQTLLIFNHVNIQGNILKGQPFQGSCNGRNNLDKRLLREAFDQDFVVDLAILLILLFVSSAVVVTATTTTATGMVVRRQGVRFVAGIGSSKMRNSNHQESRGNGDEKEDGKARGEPQTRVFRRRLVHIMVGWRYRVVNHQDIVAAVDIVVVVVVVSSSISSSSSTADSIVP
jgi:hypothetical protein